MRAQDHHKAAGPSAFALGALRAEMEALAAVLPGLTGAFRPVAQDAWTGVQDANVDTAEDEAAIEACFDNMPV